MLQMESRDWTVAIWDAADEEWGLYCRNLGCCKWREGFRLQQSGMLQMENGDYTVEIWDAAD